MPGGGSQGWALTAREVASSSHPRLWFMARGVTRRPRAGTRDRLSGVVLHPTAIEPAALRRSFSFHGSARLRPVLVPKPHKMQ